MAKDLIVIPVGVSLLGIQKGMHKTQIYVNSCLSRMSKFTSIFIIRIMWFLQIFNAICEMKIVNKLSAFLYQLFSLCPSDVGCPPFATFVRSLSLFLSIAVDKTHQINGNFNEIDVKLRCRSDSRSHIATATYHVILWPAKSAQQKGYKLITQAFLCVFSVSEIFRKLLRSLITFAKINGKISIFGEHNAFQFSFV